MKKILKKWWFWLIIIVIIIIGICIKSYVDNRNLEKKFKHIGEGAYNYYKDIKK